MAENARRGRYHPALEGAISPPPPPTAWLADPLVKPLSFVNPLHRHLRPLLFYVKTSGILPEENEFTYSSMDLALSFVFT